MDKNGEVHFKDWFKGMARHPIYGFGLLKNVEVFENKGIAKLKNRFTVDTNITPLALPLGEVYDEYGGVYTLTGETGSGVCYKNGVSIQGGLHSTRDLKIYKDYLWVRHANVISAYGPLNNAPQWFGNVVTGLNSDYNGALLVGQDDFLYTTNGNGVTKLEVTSSGTPTVAPVMVVNTTLDLPDGQYASCLAEFGTKIAIGTHGGSSYTARGSFPIARIYTWNRQAGTLGNPGLADLPVIFNENGVNAIIQHANKLYISAGTQGNVYVSDGTNFQKISTLPFSKYGVNYASTCYINAIDISQKGNILVGLSGDLSTLSFAGIYEIDLYTEGYPVSYMTPSNATIGTESTPTQFKIGFINSKTYQNTKVGYANATNYYVDGSDFVIYPTGSIETPLVRVGNFDTKKTFQEVEFALASPLVSGQSLTISYRLNDRSSYSTIGTWGFSTLGSVISFRDTAGITDAEFVQLKIELSQAVNTIYGNNINLIDVTLR